MSARGPAGPPDCADELIDWIVDRLQEPSAEWTAATAVARELPHPVNLPGMHKAVAALLARYHAMPTDWIADVLQDFMAGWLLRPETPGTIARSACSGVARGVVATVGAGIAWKLRAELLSQAHRAFTRTRRLEEHRRELLDAAERYAPLIRDAAARDVVGL